MTDTPPSPHRVTVVCSPRDHHHDAIEALERVVAHSDDVGHDLVYVLGKPPRKVGDELRRRLADLGATVVDTGQHLSPGRSRNLALSHVGTEYVVFIDNDVMVTPGWLSALLACADETGAALVAPLQLIGPLENDEIHVAAGRIVLDESTSPRRIKSTFTHQGLKVADVPEPLVREECDFVEFHCMLARRSVIEAIGGFDERLLTVREVEDTALRVRAAGESMWFEPAAKVTFVYPTEVRSWADLGLISRRWSERANRQSFDHYFAKHDLDPTQDSAIGFANGLRRPIFGPVKKVVSKLGIEKLTKGVDYGLHLLERPVNRLFVRPGEDHL